MHKKDVLAVAHIPYDSMEETRPTSKDFSVRNVSGLISGKYLITALCTVSTGLGSGLWRAVLSDGYASFLVSVLPHSITLRTIGLNKFRRSKLNTPGSDTWSMMRLTFTKMGVY